MTHELNVRLPSDQPKHTTLARSAGKPRWRVFRVRWRTVIVAVGLVLIIIGGGSAWLLSRPPKPAVLVAPGTTGVRIESRGIFGNYYPSPLLGRRPAILLLGGSEGGLSRDVQREALLLQSAGFNVLQLAYFNAPGKSPRLTRVPLEDFYSALDWLKTQSNVEPNRIGIVGYSKGAEAALIVGTRYRGIRAIVAGMPSNVVWDGLSLRSYILGGVSSWSEGGQQLPSLPYGRGDGSKNLLPRFRNALAALGKHTDAIIPAERFGGRLMLVCGGRDTLWPSCEMAEAIDRRLTFYSNLHPAMLRYPLAGHGVMGAPLGSKDPALRKWSVLGGTAEANSQARRDGWPKIIHFLNATLANQATAG